MRVRALWFVALASATAVLTAERLPHRTATRISGVVFDSLAMRGLRDATVQIADANGKALSASQITDSLGRFEFADVAPGTYLLGFFHPTLDSLGLQSAVLRVDVRTDAPIRTRLAIPSARTIVRRVCGAKSTDDSTGLMLGYLRGADNSMPRRGGKLTVRWTEVVIGEAGVRRVIPTADAVAGETGQFLICGLPVGTAIMLQGSSASDSSGAFEITVPGSGLLHRDVFVASLTRTPVTVGDSAPAVALLRGTGRLRGRVAGGGDRAVANARVMVWGTGLETTSNDSGYFSLGNLPNGTHMLEARAVGFAPAQVAVDIVDGAYDNATVELTNLGVTLSKVNVTAERLYTSRDLAEFERRMRMGLGHVYDEKELNRRQPQVLTDLFRMVPGLRIMPGATWGEEVLMRGPWGLCRPEIIVDRVRTIVDEQFPVNSIAPMNFIRAVEVYTNMVPSEFSTLSGCGVIVVWTGPRRS